MSSSAPRKPRVLLGLSGSVATVKAEALVGLLSSWASVRVVATPSALRFLPQAAVAAHALAGAPLLTDASEWAVWNRVGDTVVHIALRRWADVFVVAPLSANTLSLLAHGGADGLLACVARAWDWARPLLVAPAMNTAMWDHPFTAQVRVGSTRSALHLNTVVKRRGPSSGRSKRALTPPSQHLDALRSLGVAVIEPISKRRAAHVDASSHTLCRGGYKLLTQSLIQSRMRRRGQRRHGRGGGH